MIDELQEEHTDMSEMEDEKRGIKVGRGIYLLSRYLSLSFRQETICMSYLQE